MKITSNDIGPTSSTQQTVDSKVIELLTKLASKPLLMDKLLLSRDSGLQLILSSFLGKLQLQMPLRLAEQLQSTVNSSENNKPSVQLLLNNNNQVVLKLASPMTSNITDSARSNAASQTALQSQLVFGQAKLVGDALLKLDSPIIPTKNNQAPISDSLSPLSSGTANQNSTNKNLGLNPIFNGIKLKNSDFKGIHTLASQYSSPSLQGRLSLISFSQTNSEALSSVRVTPAEVNSSSIEPSQIIKNFLRQSFPSKGGLANNILALQKQVNVLRQLVSQNLTQVTNLVSKNSIQTANQVIAQVNSISQLMNQLTATTRAPQTSNANNIMKRLTNSGNLFENKLSALNTHLVGTRSNKDPVANPPPASSQASQFTSVKQSPIPSPQVFPNNQSNKALKNSINNQLSSTDIKLLLVQIKAQVEKLIGQINALTPRIATESTSQTSASITNSPASVTTEQIRREVDANLNAQLRKEISTGVGIPNRSRRDIPSLSNIVLSAGQNNQINKVLSEIITEVRSALNQIETNQLLSLRTEQPNIHQFLVDLPFSNNKQIDSFELLFEHKTDNSTEATKQWKVVVRFDLEPLGPMFAQVELKNNRISTDIFAESQPTAKLINEHLHVLQKSLADAGLEIDKVASSQGKIPERLVRNPEHSVDFRV